MGVPSYFRWLSDRYPYVLDDVLEGDAYKRTGRCHVGSPVPAPTTPVDADGHEPAALPDGMPTETEGGKTVQVFQVDNLYLDCNGVIHPCCHPEGGMALPKNEAEMFRNVELFLNRLFDAVQPRKLLFLAIDGVAPRAKMNQQRSRRFCSAREAEETAAEIASVRAEAASQGRSLPAVPDKRWDHNVITPGTEFMDRLAVFLRSYLKKQLRDHAGTDSRWAGLTVILSDATVPGEGEHKIMEYIRAAKRTPGYDANTSHCICGQDADLMMLSLSLHEPRVCILREKVTGGRKKKKGPSMDTFLTRPLQFLHVSRLRAYLRLDFKILSKHKMYNFERVIDDYVFICFLVGNDFLPHPQALGINDGGIDLIQLVYCQTFERLGGFLTNGHEVNKERLGRLMQVLGAMEFEIFRAQHREQDGQAKRRKEKDEKEAVMEAKRVERKRAQLANRKKRRAEKAAAKSAGAKKEGGEQQDEQESEGEMYDLFDDSEDDQENKIASPLSAKELKELVDKAKLAADEVVVKGESDMALWKDGWRNRYYKAKLGNEENTDVQRMRMVHEFVRGMCWVMHYYFKGVASWDWYYPFHYSPLVIDFVHLEAVNTSFTYGAPFPPIAQLMAVLPAASGHSLPIACQRLMEDPKSPIIDFYPPLTGPGRFRVDPNGKPARVRWLWVAMLPFIDSTRLLAVIDGIKHTFTPEETKRNTLGFVEIYTSARNPAKIAQVILSAYEAAGAGGKGGVLVPFDAECGIPGEMSALMPEGNTMLKEYKVLFGRYEPAAVAEHISAFNKGGVVAAVHAIPLEHVKLPTKPPRLPLPPQVVAKVLRGVGAHMPPNYEIRDNGGFSRGGGRGGHRGGRGGRRHGGGAQSGGNCGPHSSQSGRNRALCRAGASCTRPACYFTHPSDRPVSAPVTTNTSTTRGMPGRCRMGSSCVRPGCTFSHQGGPTEQGSKADVMRTLVPGQAMERAASARNPRSHRHMSRGGGRQEGNTRQQAGHHGHTASNRQHSGKTSGGKYGPCRNGPKCARDGCRFSHE